MDREQLEAAATPLAQEVVDRYARRATPVMSEAGRRILLGHLVRRLALAMHLSPIGDWSDHANAALDEWEDQARTTGPRVEAFDDAGGGVSVRMRADA